MQRMAMILAVLSLMPTITGCATLQSGLQVAQTLGAATMRGGIQAAQTLGMAILKDAKAVVD